MANPLFNITQEAARIAAEAAARVATSAALRARVVKLAQDQEALAKQAVAGKSAHAKLTTPAMRTRVRNLARQAELDMKASLAKKKADIISGQNSRITTGKGPESVGYRDAPLPGSLAAIPRGGDVLTLNPVGAQIPTRSSFYKRRK